MENLIDIMQLSTEEIDELVKTGCDIMEHPAKYAHKLSLIHIYGAAEPIGRGGSPTGADRA